MRSNTLSGPVSLDTSVLVELLSGTQLSRPIYQAIEEESVDAHTSYPALAEAEYVLCRQKGGDLARNKVDSLIFSRTVEVIDDQIVLHDAASLKCRRAIALVDCFSIAVAELIHGKAVFARREEDIERELKKKPFPTEVVFLDELPKD